MQESPKFLLIIMDQHRADYLGFYGNDAVRTANIDGARETLRYVLSERQTRASGILPPSIHSSNPCRPSPRQARLGLDVQRWRHVICLLRTRSVRKFIG